MKSAKDEKPEPARIVEELNEDVLISKCQEIWKGFQDSNQFEENNKY
jgi:hypothetical protein